MHSTFQRKAVQPGLIFDRVKAKLKDMGVYQKAKSGMVEAPAMLVQHIPSNRPWTFIVYFRFLTESKDMGVYQKAKSGIVEALA